MAITLTCIAFVGLLRLPLDAGVAGESFEHYRLISVPDRDESRSEIDDVTIKSTDAFTVYRFHTQAQETVRRGWVRTGPDGRFAAALRIVTENGEEEVRDSLWVDGDRLFARRVEDGERTTSDYELSPEKPAAVGASLLLWLRRFPFRSGREIRVFMVDYGHRHVDVVVRERGVETVEVPAGTFDCHRMEVEVQVPIFNPKITFWVTVDAPHFLVRHEGKRGPFTPTYRTRLVEIGKDR